MPHANRWRKRYLGRTYYLKTDVGGRTDRDGYLAALAEWQRVKAHVDGFGPNPYTSTGVPAIARWGWSASVRKLASM